MSADNAAYVSQLEEALFECYRLSGADTDGARSFSDMGEVDIAKLAVEAVGALLDDYNELLMGHDLAPDQGAEA